MVDKLSSTPPARPELVRHDALKRSDGVSAAPNTAHASKAAAGTSNTASSSLIDRAKAAAAEVPEVDRQKVDDIKLAIARGEFQVNPKAVAQAFVSMTLNATRA